MGRNKLDPQEKIDDRLQGMPPRAAFWHALATVAPAVLIAFAIFLYVRGADTEIWPIYMVIILVPAAFLLLMIFNRYRNGHERPQLTRKQHLINAIANGLLAIGYLAVNVVKHKGEWGSWYTWVFTATWLLFALVHLQHSHQKEQVEPPTAS